MKLVYRSHLATSDLTANKKNINVRGGRELRGACFTKIWQDELFLYRFAGKIICDYLVGEKFAEKDDFHRHYLVLNREN